MKTAKISLYNIKNEGWNEVAGDLGFSYEKSREIFEYGEYGAITIIIDENLNIIAGKIIPCGK